MVKDFVHERHILWILYLVETAVEVGVELCHRYATVREPKRSGASDTQICASNSRQTLVYTSRTNSVIVQMSSQAVEDPSTNFLIRFKGRLLLTNSVILRQLLWAPENLALRKVISGYHRANLQLLFNLKL